VAPYGGKAAPQADRSFELASRTAELHEACSRTGSQWRQVFSQLDDIQGGVRPCQAALHDIREEHEKKFGVSSASL
jgi:hypothetical protein